MNSKFKLLVKMIENNESIESIKKMLNGIDVNGVFVNDIKDSKFNCEDCLLNVATENCNYEATKLLLELGANPNTYKPQCPLNNLQWSNKGNWKDKYRIAKLFFEHGADPNSIFDDCESMYDAVFFRVFNDLPDSDDDIEYLLNLFKLLIVYGGGSDNTHYPKLDISNVNIDKIDEYKFNFVSCDDGKRLKGALIDKEGKIIVDI